MTSDRQDSRASDVACALIPVVKLARPVVREGLTGFGQIGPRPELREHPPGHLETRRCRRLVRLSRDDFAGLRSGWREKQNTGGRDRDTHRGGHHGRLPGNLGFLSFRCGHELPRYPYSQESILDQAYATPHRVDQSGYPAQDNAGTVRCTTLLMTSSVHLER